LSCSDGNKCNGARDVAEAVGIAGEALARAGGVAVGGADVALLTHAQRAVATHACADHLRVLPDRDAGGDRATLELATRAHTDLAGRHPEVCLHGCRRPHLGRGTRDVDLEVAGREELILRGGDGGASAGAEASLDVQNDRVVGEELRIGADLHGGGAVTTDATARGQATQDQSGVHADGDGAVEAGIQDHGVTRCDHDRLGARDGGGERRQVGEGDWQGDLERAAGVDAGAVLQDGLVGEQPADVGAVQQLGAVADGITEHRARRALADHQDAVDIGRRGVTAEHQRTAAQLDL